jgi:hypothetical protein
MLACGIKVPQFGHESGIEGHSSGRGVPLQYSLLIIYRGAVGWKPGPTVATFERGIPDSGDEGV